MPHSIAKRVFLAARQCLTWGWYDQYATRSDITPALEWQFWTGNEIGRRARAFLGNGCLLPMAPHDTAVQSSLAALDDTTAPLLFEVTLTWRAFTARADALRRTANGWELIEVKSGKSSGKSSSKDDVSPEYIDDLAYTLFVARSAGVHVERATLVLIDHEYVRDVGPFFRSIDVTDAVHPVADTFAAEAPAIEHALLSTERPEPALKFVCKACPHFDTQCIGRDIPDPLFDIPRLSKGAFEQLREYERISRLPPHTKLTDIQRRHVDSMRTGKPWIGRNGLSALDDVVWPAHYLDFEAIGPALPWFDGLKSYDVVPFQYSVHSKPGPDAQPVHHEFLGTPATDWRRDLAETLLHTLGDRGSIIVYSSYEKTQLTNMARVFPDLLSAIDGLLARLFDLEKIFRDGYIHPAFRGRTSIKKVLPVLTTESYADMDIADGLNAAAVFALMHVGVYPPDSHATHRTRLLEYCKLDTHAMVRLHAAAMQIHQDAKSVAD